MCLFLHSQKRVKSLSIIGLALIAIVQTRLSLPRPATEFSTADNPIAKAPSILTRFLTFSYLPAFNFKLLMIPSELSFDWGMDAIPRINTVSDIRNIFSIVFYASLSLVVFINGKRLHRHWTNEVLAKTSDRQRKSRILRKRRIIQLTQTTVSSTTMMNLPHNFNVISNNNNCSLIDNKNIINLSRDNECNVSNSNANINAAVNNNYTNKSIDCLCSICNDGLNLRHSSSCRAINNNNAPSTHCGCPKRRKSSSPSPRNQNNHQRHHQRQQHHQKTRQHNQRSQQPSTTTLQSSSQQKFHQTTLSSSSSQQSLVPLSVMAIVATTASFIANAFNDVWVTTIPSILCRISIKNLSAINILGDADSINSKMTNSDAVDENTITVPQPSTKTPIVSNAILLSIALMVLTFLPATNLFFYVGFVVAERILYLPSVGFCLLIGLSGGALIDSNPSEPSKGVRQRQRHAIMLCISIALMAYSAKTIVRNIDWRDEESLYRSAIHVNPPKGNFPFSHQFNLLFWIFLSHFRSIDFNGIDLFHHWIALFNRKVSIAKWNGTKLSYNKLNIDFCAI